MGQKVNATAYVHKPLCFYALAICHELVFLAFLWLLLRVAISAYYIGFMQDVPILMTLSAWDMATKILAVCVILMMAFIFLLRANGRAYRPTVYILLGLAAVFCGKLLYMDLDRLLMGLLYYTIVLLVLTLIGLYIYKSKKLKAYFGEE